MESNGGRGGGCIKNCGFSLLMMFWLWLTLLSACCDTLQFWWGLWWGDAELLLANPFQEKHREQRGGKHEIRLSFLACSRFLCFWSWHGTELIWWGPVIIFKTELLRDPNRDASRYEWPDFFFQAIKSYSWAQILYHPQRKTKYYRGLRRSCAALYVQTILNSQGAPNIKQTKKNKQLIRAIVLECGNPPKGRNPPSWIL